MSLSSEERKDILRKLSEGVITVPDASFMLNGTDYPRVEKKAVTIPDPDQRIRITKEELNDSYESRIERRPRWFHIRVNDLKSGKNRVAVNIPLRLINMGLKIGQRFAPELNDFDWQEIDSQLSQESSVLIDVTDESGGEHVLIYVD